MNICRSHNSSSVSMLDVVYSSSQRVCEVSRERNGTSICHTEVCSKHSLFLSDKACTLFNVGVRGKPVGYVWKLFSANQHYLTEDLVYSVSLERCMIPMITVLYAFCYPNCRLCVLLRTPYTFSYSSVLLLIQTCTPILENKQLSMWTFCRSLWPLFLPRLHQEMEGFNTYPQNNHQVKSHDIV